MDDPFFVLLKNMQSLFNSVPKRNAKYIYPEVQQLKEAFERYNSESEATFQILLAAIAQSMPHIEKYRLDFGIIKKSLEQLSRDHKLPNIDWASITSHPKLSLAFQFNALNVSEKHEEPLNIWLSEKLKKSFFNLDSDQKVNALIGYINYPEFNLKLKDYQKQQPEFLFNLIMDSEQNFVKICSTRLILHLTDLQIASGILKHLYSFLSNDESEFEQVNQLVGTLNDILSNGLSISTLLRNSKARSLLLNSIYFQIYQSKEYSRHQFHMVPPLPLNSEFLKF